MFFKGQLSYLRAKSLTIMPHLSYDMICKIAMYTKEI